MGTTKTLALPVTTPSRSEGAALWFVVTAVLIWSGFATQDLFTWTLEIVWVAVVLIFLAIVWRRFPLTQLLCWLLFAHALVLIEGGIDTYAEAPIGFWL